MPQVTATIEHRCTITEVLDATGVVDSAVAANRTVTHTLFNKSSQLNGTPSASQAATKLTANFLKVGEGNIDLTDLIGTNGIQVDGTGKKVIYCRITNLGVNDVTIKTADANGHDFWGTGEVTIYGGGTITNEDKKGVSTTINASNRYWTVTAGGSEIFDLEMTFLLGDAATS